MNLSELREAVGSLGHLHGLTPCDINGLHHDGQGVRVEVDLSDLRSELEEAREESAKCQQEASDNEAEIDRLTDELETANNRLDEVKDDAGGTLREYADRAEQAEARAESWYKEYKRMDAELTALRRRKGMLAALYANQSAVMDLLRDAQAGNPIDAAKAKELCQKITNDSRT